jgi:hypothetical protein
MREDLRKRFREDAKKLGTNLVKGTVNHTTAAARKIGELTGKTKDLLSGKKRAKEEEKKPGLFGRITDSFLEGFYQDRDEHWLLDEEKQPERD